MAANDDSANVCLVNFGKMERPRKIVVEKETATDVFTRFVAEPFERVFGHSIGNALRRILLSSMETPGVISCRLEGVPHEFTAIDGIVEDMTNIVLNVKGALLRCLPVQEGEYTRESRIVSSHVNVSQSDLDKNGGKIEFTLKDAIKDSLFEIVNPDLHLFTVTKPMKKQFDLRVGYGRGYVPSERHVIANKLVDEIVIDTAFSPVRVVNYFVENTRVGQDTDYDRLVLEVTTDGRLTPVEALTFAAQVVAKNLEAFHQIKVYDLAFDQEVRESQSDDSALLDKIILRIDEIELSVRSTNCLGKANIETIAELVCIPQKEMLEYRNFGKKSLNEIEAKLAEMKLGLGMDLSQFGIDRDNVKEKIKEIAEERKAEREKKKKNQ